jgi:hypothetical protein
MSITMTPSAKGAADDLRESMSQKLRGAVERTSIKAQAKLRVQAAGMRFKDGGRGVANSWRTKTYPRAGVVTLEPAALVYTNAPRIVEAFANGVTIRARNHRYLTFPTGYNAVRGRRQNGGRNGVRVTPQEMISSGKSFLVPFKSGRGYLWCLPLERQQGTTRTGRRKTIYSAGGLATVLTGRDRYRKVRIADARVRGYVAMYFLMRQVEPGKRLDIDAVVEAAERDLLDELSRMGD